MSTEWGTGPSAVPRSRNQPRPARRGRLRLFWARIRATWRYWQGYPQLVAQLRSLTRLQDDRFDLLARLTEQQRDCPPGTVIPFDLYP
jgi:hypothetical protein